MIWRELPAPRSIALALALELLAAGAAHAIDPNRAVSQYVLDRWGIEQGFPQGPVYAIAQTGDGYLWIGTEAGLVRFDGWNFRLIRDDSGAFTITGVLGLSTDNDGGLWVRLQDLSVLRYRNGRFESPSNPERNTNFSAMNRGNRGQILLARMETGAFSYHDRAFQMVASAARLPRSPVISLAQTPNGDIWMGTRDAGIFRVGGAGTTPLREGLPDLKIDCVLPDGDRDVWIGTDDGIVRWNGSSLTTEGIPPSLHHLQALAMVKDRDGNIWVGTDSRGLVRLNSRGAAWLDETAVPSNPAITAIYEDREGNLWIGSAGGLVRLRDSAFVTWSLAEGLPSDGSNPVYVDREGRMWFPPVTGGLWWAKDSSHGQIGVAGLDRDIVYSIAGRNDEIWIGRQHGGLTRLLPSTPGISNGERAAFTATTWTEREGLAQNSVYSVYESRDGTVWAGTLSGGVSRLSLSTSGSRLTTYTTANGLISDTVASILEDSRGTMWFATPGGLSELSGGLWHSWTAADGLPSEKVNCLLEDSAGVLWAGTTAGLAFRRGQRFKIPDGAPASLRTQVLGIAEDGEGWFWMATSNRVLRVKRDKLLKGNLGEGDIREYGMEDGLRGVEGVKRHQSVFRDSTGRIWFSLNHGISVVDPARLASTLAPVPVHVETISADGVAVDFSTPIHVPGGRRRVTFGYAGISLSVAERVRYRYRLDNFEREWNGPVAGREAVYTNLGPGSYRFRVMASNSDGIWGRGETSIPFVVDPLFWQTWWFLAAASAALGITVASLYRLRLHQMTKRLNRRFEERLAERMRIAQELHDTLLQGFISASMQLYVATDRLPPDSRGKQSLNTALELVRQVIEDGRNAVRGLRSSHSSSLDLEQAFSRVGDEFMAREQEGGKVDFRVVVEGDRRPLHPLLRDEVYRIGREALINAFRHAQAKTIELEIKYFPHRLVLLVRDDGRGIDPRFVQAGREGHWGLVGMRERAERIGARMHVFSSGASGTEVELSVPAHLAFRDQPTRKLWWAGRRSRSRNRAAVQADSERGDGR